MHKIYNIEKQKVKQFGKIIYSCQTNYGQSKGIMFFSNGVMLATHGLTTPDVDTNTINRGYN